MYLYREKCRNINYINFSTRKIGLLSMADDLSITFELKHCAIIIYHNSQYRKEIRSSSWCAQCHDCIWGRAVDMQMCRGGTAWRGTASGGPGWGSAKSRQSHSGIHSPEHTPSAPNPSVPSSLAPSYLAQMKFSATLHSNAIKARIAGWYPRKRMESQVESRLFFTAFFLLSAFGRGDFRVSPSFVNFEKSNCNL